ncbi:hypothetical protein [Nonomuraea sp. NPDC050310]|uniref:hypothetical protein n=1 Tax=Nonomuraea sp. NPDC050310 TaxID=3154935 RepID=UPI0033C56359
MASTTASPGRDTGRPAPSPASRSVKVVATATPSRYGPPISASAGSATVVQVGAPGKRSPRPMIAAPSSAQVTSTNRTVVTAKASVHATTGPSWWR